MLYGEEEWNTLSLVNYSQPFVIICDVRYAEQGGQRFPPCVLRCPMMLKLHMN